MNKVSDSLNWARFAREELQDGDESLGKEAVIVVLNCIISEEG